MKRVFNGAAGKGRGNSVTGIWSKVNSCGNAQAMTYTPGCRGQIVGRAGYPEQLVVTDIFTQDKNAFLKYMSHFKHNLLGWSHPLLLCLFPLQEIAGETAWVMSNWKWKLNPFCCVIILCNTYAIIWFCTSLCTLFFTLRDASMLIIYYYYLYILCTY